MVFVGSAALRAFWLVENDGWHRVHGGDSRAFTVRKLSGKVQLWKGARRVVRTRRLPYAPSPAIAAVGSHDKF
eukprot:4987548-Pleurochrysis_carterae.AAC.1